MYFSLGQEKWRMDHYKGLSSYPDRGKITLEKSSKFEARRFNGETHLKLFNCSDYPIHAVLRTD
jgi:hypothetical protein